MFTMLLSADLCVSDPDELASVLTSQVGLVGRPAWRQEFEGHGYIAHFLRAHKSLAVAPTRVEVIGFKPEDAPYDPGSSAYMQSMLASQSPNRPVKTHSTVIVTDDFDSVVERLISRNVPFRTSMPSKYLPPERLWLGSTAEQPGYDPSADGGLFIEIMALAPLQMPLETFDSPPPAPPEPSPGAIVRIVGRGFLVRDLRDTLTRLEKSLDWIPAAVETYPDEGFTRARMPFSLSHSATLDLIQPTSWDTPSARYLARYGPGPFYIRLSVHDLDARAELLRQAGVRFEMSDYLASAAGRVLTVDPSAAGGGLFEFVEHVD